MNDSKNDTRNDKSRDEIEQEKQDEAILDSAIASADTHESNKAAMKESVEEEKEIVTQKVRSPSDTWAANVDRVKVKEQPGGAFAATLEDRMIVSPLEGFGPLWRRTYRVRIPGDVVSAEDLMALWKAEFPRFQPKENSFYPTSAGVKPGEMVYIDSTLLNVAGLDAMTEVSSGVMVIYADEVSFTVMTPEGFPVSGWNTFSAYEDDGFTVAQVQGLERSTDPIYEFGYRFMGGEKAQDRTWCHVLRSLAEHYGVTTEVETSKECVDPRMNWKQAGNVVHNAMIHTLLFRVSTPFRWLRDNLLQSNKKTS